MGKSKKEPDNILICGQSGSGKTYAARALAEERGNPVVLLNSKSSDEYDGLEVIEGDWDTICFDAPRLTYIVEDISGLSKKNKEAVTRLTCHASRHNSSTVILITYQINCTGISAFISHLTTVLFTSAKINSRSLAKVLRHFSYPDEAAVMALFSRLGKRDYLRLEPQRQASGVQSFEPSSHATDSEEDDDDKPTASFDVEKCWLYFKHREDADCCRMLLAFLSENLPAGCVRPKDWSIAGKDEDESDLRVSLIDYVAALRTPKEKPSPDVEALHEWIVSNYCLPGVLVANARLKK